MMKSMAMPGRATLGGKVAVNDQAVKMLASTIFKQLQEEGCEARDIISVSSQLIDLVTTQIQCDETAQQA